MSLVISQRDDIKKTVHLARKVLEVIKNGWKIKSNNRLCFGFYSLICVVFPIVCDQECCKLSYVQLQTNDAPLLKGNQHQAQIGVVTDHSTSVLFTIELDIYVYLAQN